MNLNCRLKRNTPSIKRRIEEKLVKRCKRKISLFMIGYDTFSGERYDPQSHLING